MTKKTNKTKQEKENTEDTSRPGFIDSIRGAIIDLDMYDKFRKLKLSSSASFFLAFLFIIVFLNALNFSFTVFRMIDKLATFYEKNIPTIEIKKGEAKVLTDKGMPLIIYYEEPGFKLPLVIDTTGETKNLDKYERGILLTQTEVQYKQTKDNVEKIPLSKYKDKDMTINSAMIRGQKTAYFKNIFPLVLILWFLFKAASTAFLILVFAGVGFMLAKQKKLSLSFSGAINISMYATVPALLILTVLHLLGVFRIMGKLVSPQGAWAVSSIIFYLIIPTYLYLGIDKVQQISSQNIDNETDKPKTDEKQTGKQGHIEK
ncbi:MAG: DUF1189 domain-containing protein [Candidatus Eremiobacteraeota bacterium]|nr:DUF1189 domain-containing protein [Candidatus Eremiobacteraeota bacterium]